MKRSIIRNGLWIGLVCAGLAGCQSDRGHGSVARKSKPEDPTAWTGSEISKDEPASSKGLPKSSGLQGGLSSEARDIENSLGVGR
jgi:hypothetical protein